MIELPDLPNETLIMLAILLIALVFLVFYAIVNMIDMAYVIYAKRPLYRFLIPPFSKLSKPHLKVLETQFPFYSKLSHKNKRVFQHRLAKFIKRKNIVGRDGLIVNDDMIVLISATSIMLTLGFRDYTLRGVKHIIVYPSIFYSNINESHHKGEYNPKLETLVFSWEHFLEGYDVTNDNLNLGIHEFAHAIHLNSLKNKDVSATIFVDGFSKLTAMLSDNKSLKNRLISSEYFRDYAFTNQFEFIAVLIENFIETQQEFKSQFPSIYVSIKQMLNFNFKGY